jgi:hypothetical protein
MPSSLELPPELSVVGAASSLKFETPTCVAGSTVGEESTASASWPAMGRLGRNVRGAGNSGRIHSAPRVRTSDDLHPLSARIERRALREFAELRRNSAQGSVVLWACKAFPVGPTAHYLFCGHGSAERTVSCRR